MTSKHRPTFDICELLQGGFAETSSEKQKLGKRMMQLYGNPDCWWFSSLFAPDAGQL